MIAMKRFTDMVSEALRHVTELMPWDVDEMLGADSTHLVLDIREPAEFDAMHIRGSMHVPRGILEMACEYGYEDTVTELVRAREREVVVVCRSGNRSVLAAATMQQLGYGKVCSMKTGLRGWNDYELPLVDANGKTVPVEQADEYFATRLRQDQMVPER